jgi:hypothetical protein
MDFRREEIEKVIPLFTGVLCSLFACAMMAFHSPLFTKVESEIFEENYDNREDAAVLFLGVAEETRDPVMEYYRDPEYREWVIEFFAGICSSRDIALAILESADEFDVPAALAFALGWEESKFNPRAINRFNRDGSIDRGLFQLNNRSFPNLEPSAFFSIKANARFGISHLKFCLDSGGSEISALAMYNAGTGRVSTSGAPKVTLDYISRILENRMRIESRFHSRLIKEEESRLAEKAKNASPNHFSRTLSSASPL